MPQSTGPVVFSSGILNVWYSWLPFFSIWVPDDHQFLRCESECHRVWYHNEWSEPAFDEWDLSIFLRFLFININGLTFWVLTMISLTVVGIGEVGLFLRHNFINDALIGFGFYSYHKGFMRLPGFFNPFWVIGRDATFLRYQCFLVMNKSLGSNSEIRLSEYLPQKMQEDAWKFSNLSWHWTEI